MDLLLQFQAIVGLLVLVLIYHRYFASNHVNKSKAMEAPEVPGAWPIIGHLVKIAVPQPLFRTLADMADKHGPAFTLRLGVHRTLIISSWELAKECFTTNDLPLANHPRSAAGKYMSFGYAMFGFAPYGPYWREIRKCVVLELLSNRRLESLKHVRYAEIDNCMKDLYGLWVKNSGNQVKVQMSEFFRDLILNLILKMVVGKRYLSAADTEHGEEFKRIQKTIDDFFQLSGAAVASDLLPSFLSWIDFDGRKRAMKRTAEDMDAISERWLQEHRQKRLSGKANGDEKDLIDVMLSILEEDSQLHGHDHDSVVKATALNLILAGTDSTSISLSWIISLLLNHKEVLQKAQDELDSQIGKDRNVEERDIANLVYLQAIIKETFRLYPAAPFLVPHEAIEDCTFSSGFRVSQGTRVFVNVWKINRDPRIWSNPLEFQPERFLTSHVDVDLRGKHFELIPFGSGRRSCPGVLFALQTVSMTVARLLHGFSIQTPSNLPVDMTEGIASITLSKKFPLEVLLTPRLPSHLYA